MINRPPLLVIIPGTLFGRIPFGESCGRIGVGKLGKEDPFEQGSGLVEIHLVQGVEGIPASAPKHSIPLA